MNIPDNFEDLLDLCPEVMKDKIMELSTIRERPDYHPEENCYEHVRIVTERCMMYKDADLIMSGLLHDIRKVDYNRISEKTGYPTAPGHDKGAVRFIERNSDVQEFILEMGADIENVKEICGEHMRIKVFDQMKRSKKARMMELANYDKLLKFTKADNMLQEFVL